VGASYTGFEKWILACDARWFAYSSAQGFGPGGFAANGALTGLDWDDVYAIAFGVQRELTERITVRCGYCYNTNPISSDAVTYNIASPAITQHVLALGGSYMFAEAWMFHATYIHAVENEVTGPIHPANLPPLPGSSVSTRAAAHAIAVGFTKKF
jgi:long-chain fatty acid transport protein